MYVDNKVRFIVKLKNPIMTVPNFSGCCVKPQLSDRVDSPIENTKLRAVFSNRNKK